MHLHFRSLLARPLLCTAGADDEIVAHLGLESTVPVPMPARPPPQLELAY